MRDCRNAAVRMQLCRVALLRAGGVSCRTWPVRGVYQFAMPPWLARDQYLLNSPISHVDKVETPVMLIQGNLDFVPIEQGEEYFTALYRQGKRAEFVRYVGEWHTISNRENVLDLWKRIKEWLKGNNGSRTVTVARE